MNPDPVYTDTLEVTYDSGTPGTSSFAVAKVIAKHPGAGKHGGDIESHVVDTAGTTVAAYMAQHHPDKKILSFRPVPQRPLTAQAQVTTELTPLSREETKRFEAAIADAAALDFGDPLMAPKGVGPALSGDPLNPPTADEYKIDTAAEERRRLSILESVEGFASEPVDGSARK